MTIGDRIFHLRLRKQITQNELGDVLGVSGEMISAWEDNIMAPDNANLKKICDFFDVPFEYIMNGVKQVDVKALTNRIINLFLISLGCLSLVNAVVFSYLFKSLEMAVYGECFSEARYYLFHYPLIILVIFGMSLFFIGFFRLILVVFEVPEDNVRLFKRRRK